MENENLKQAASRLRESLRQAMQPIRGMAPDRAKREFDAFVDAALAAMSDLDKRITTLEQRRDQPRAD